MNFIKALIIMAVLYVMAPAILILTQSLLYMMGGLFLVVFSFALIGGLNANKVSKEDFQRVDSRED